MIEKTVTDIVLANRLDPELLQQVLTWQQTGQQKLTLARSMVVDDPTMETYAAKDLAEIRLQRKTVEETRKLAKEPILDAGRKLDALFKELTEPLDEADKVLTGKVMAYRDLQRRLAREAEEAKREEELQDNLSVAPQPYLEPAKAVRTDAGTMSDRESWKFEVVDFGLLPDKYKLANMQLIGGEARNLKDKTDIPGVKVWVEYKPQVR